MRRFQPVENGVSLPRVRRLGGIDAAFLYAETPAWHMHVSALLTIDPSTGPNGFSFDTLKKMTVARLPGLPQFRWRPVEVPLGLDRPVWVEAEDFDPDYHIRRIAVPSPGGPEELSELVGRIIGYKLDRSKPLWEMWVIEGLADGRVAVVTKVHHAIVDGVSGAGLAEILLDIEPDAARPAPEMRGSLHHEGMPNSWVLLGEGLITAAFRTPYRMFRYGVELVRKGWTFGEIMRREHPPKTPLSTPRTPFNQAITPHRSFASSSVPLDRVKAIKDAYDVKLNDVVLALCAGALRRYLEHVDELPEQSLVAQVPVSLRTESDDDVGTKVGPMFASLETAIDDPVKRLLAIHDYTTRAKEMRSAMTAHGIMGLTETTPPGLLTLAARMYTAAGLENSGLPLYNVIISNVPGPPMPLFMAGARLESLYPMGPLILGCGLNITVISYCGSLDFGFLTCPETVPETDFIAEGIPAALEELERAAGLPGDADRPGEPEAAVAERPPAPTPASVGPADA
jgi:WS/DGAT/MGAT family acyltransferase